MNSMQQVLDLFKQKPYLIRMGAKKISAISGFSIKDIKEARSHLRHQRRQCYNSQVKILIFDIETSPLKGFVWSRWKQNIYLDQTIAEWFMISWSAKWVGSDIMYSDVLTPEEILKEDDKRITGGIWKLLDEADIVVAHNGKRFDIPKLNSRFILNRLSPPAPYKQIDTKEVSARQFGFSSNKLDALAGYFDIPHKSDTNFQLWGDCLEGKQEALDYMRKYNEQDVRILERVYLRLRPWIKNHPNIAVFIESDEIVCPYCGSASLVETDNYYPTQVNKYKTLRCKECGGIARRRTTAYPKDKRENLVTSI